MSSASVLKRQGDGTSAATATNTNRASPLVMAESLSAMEVAGNV
jgi:hypothetical protein